MIASYHLKITSCSRCPGVIHKRPGDVSEWLASCKACEKARWQPNEHLGFDKAITQAIHFEDSSDTWSIRWTCYGCEFLILAKAWFLDYFFLWFFYGLFMIAIFCHLWFFNDFFMISCQGLGFSLFLAIFPEILLARVLFQRFSTIFGKFWRPLTQIIKKSLKKS